MRNSAIMMSLTALALCVGMSGCAMMNRCSSGCCGTSKGGCGGPLQKLAGGPIQKGPHQKAPVQKGPMQKVACGKGCGGKCRDGEFCLPDLGLREMFGVVGCFFTQNMSCAGGCGEVYWNEWYSDPPSECDPCNRHGDWVGPPAKYSPKVPRPVKYRKKLLFSSARSVISDDGGCGSGCSSCGSVQKGGAIQKGHVQKHGPIQKGPVIQK